MSKVKPAPLPPDTVIGDYRIIRKVSAGGFGVVYLALDPEDQQKLRSRNTFRRRWRRVLPASCYLGFSRTSCRCIASV